MSCIFESCLILTIKTLLYLRKIKLYIFTCFHLQGDHNHLFIRQGTGLQGQAVFRNKLTFRPHSTESFTHRKMTMSLADRSQKTTGIKILSQVGHDPDADRKWNLKVILFVFECQYSKYSETMKK